MGARRTATERRRPRRLLRAGVAAVALVAAAWVLATAALSVRPRSDRPPERTDAVVVFAGGRGERLDAARDLVAGGAAPVLVVSNGTDPAWPEADRLCSQPQPFAVLCPRPDPDTTRGEARATARLAAERGWSSVVLVASTYHARRAGVLLRRCLDGDGDATDVAVVAAAPRQGWARTWWLAAREWAGLARALVADRRC